MITSVPVLEQVSTCTRAALGSAGLRPSATRRAETGHARALDTNAKSATPPHPEIAHLHTGEILNSANAQALELLDRRLKRWDLQGAARTLLPGERVSHCLRTKQSVTQRVKVYKRCEGEGTYYGGLQTCGSVWNCPVCSQKVSERRRVELDAGIEAWKGMGGTVLLLTATVPHTRSDAALDLVDEVLELNRLFWSGRGIRLILKSSGYVGQVRALEVTHGVNGWHPHLHTLLFVARGVNLEVLRVKLFERWRRYALGVGFTEPSLSAFTLQDGEQASRYVGKWGLAQELTKANVKQGRQGGRTPFALLADYEKGDEQAGALFVQYARAFKGRRQLFWSHKLKDLLGLKVEKTDEELAAQVDALDALLGTLTDDQWKLIKSRELRGQVLEVARLGDWNSVLQFIEETRKHGKKTGPQQPNEIDSEPGRRVGLSRVRPPEEAGNGLVFGLRRETTKGPDSNPPPLSRVRCSTGQAREIEVSSSGPTCPVSDRTSLVAGRAGDVGRDRKGV